MKTLLLVPVGLLIIIYLVIAQILPLNRDRIATIEENKIIAQEVKAVRIKVTEVGNFLQSASENQDVVDFLDEYVPVGDTEEGLVNFLSRTTRNRGLDVLSLDFGEGVSSIEERGTFEAPGSSELKAVSVDMQMIGNYSSFFDFSRDIYVLKRLFRMDSIDISRVDDGGGESDLLEINVAMTYYYMDSVNVSSDDRFGNLSFDRVREFASQLTSVDSIAREQLGRRDPFGR